MKDGGPAFPRIGQTVEFGDGWIDGHPGMSLRDYFAGQWLAGLAAAPDLLTTKASEIAEICYKVADAMLAEREKGQS